MKIEYILFVFVIPALSFWIGYRFGFVAGMRSARLIIAKTFNKQREEEKAYYV